MPTPKSFCDVLEILNHEKVRYVVVGGFAAVMHGVNRDIPDLDIVVDPSGNEPQRCMDALALAGFIPSIPLPPQLLTVVRLFDQRAREIDVFFRYKILFEELWSNSRLVMVGNQTARIAGLEHILQAKRVYNDPDDHHDVEALMSAHENQKLDLSLREAIPEDESFLFEVYASTRLDELEGTGWNDDQKRGFIRMQFVARERSTPRADNQIILLNGNPVGRMLVDRSETGILLRDIALLTEYRNAGIGSRLIQELMKEATSAGKPIQLHVLASSPAVRLYERLGFSTSGDEAAYLEMQWAPVNPGNPVTK
jgi:ribosomal protein S18 acetylase RimI-like enzyme